MAKLRDKFWVWGHPENRYYNEYGNYKKSRMTPMEGALYMGARNMFMVPVGVDVNVRQYNKSFTTLNQLGWCVDNAVYDPHALEILIEQAKDFPNITCGVFDDFIGHLKQRPMPPDDFHAVHERMHHNGVRPLDMWMVLYTQEFGLNADDDRAFLPYIAPFDGIIMWTWKERDIVLFEEKFELFKKMTADKRRMLGLYLYNFGESRQATGTVVKWQLDRYRELLYSGEVEGVVLHTNTMADLDYEAYDVETEWMRKHGDELID